MLNTVYTVAKNVWANDNNLIPNTNLTDYFFNDIYKLKFENSIEIVASMA
jgi:hypothetical protein